MGIVTSRVKWLSLCKSSSPSVSVVLEEDKSLAHMGYRQPAWEINKDFNKPINVIASGITLSKKLEIHSKEKKTEMLSMINFGKDLARNSVVGKNSPAVTPVLPLSISVLDWFVKNKTERNSSQSKVIIVYSKATSRYQFLDAGNCPYLIALLKGSLKARIPLSGLPFLWKLPLSS